MIQAIINIFRIAELRNRVFFTMTMIAIYRIGFWIPLAGVNQQQMVEAAQKAYHWPVATWRARLG